MAEVTDVNIKQNDPSNTTLKNNTGDPVFSGSGKNPEMKLPPIHVPIKTKDVSFNSFNNTVDPMLNTMIVENVEMEELT